MECDIRPDGTDHRNNFRIFHRAAPAPIQQGTSFRKLPEASFDQLRKICLHYERKGAGVYEEAGGRTARYLYDLAHEVLSQVDALERKYVTALDEREARLVKAENLIKEWNAFFGAKEVGIVFCFFSVASEETVSHSDKQGKQKGAVGGGGRGGGDGGGDDEEMLGKFTPESLQKQLRAWKMEALMMNKKVQEYESQHGECCPKEARERETRARQRRGERECMC